MKVIDVFNMSNGVFPEYLGVNVEYYASEFEWLRQHALKASDNAKAVYIGSYTMLLDGDAFYSGVRFPTDHETMKFVLNESQRIWAEAKEVSYLYDIAIQVAAEPANRAINYHMLLGLQEYTGVPLDSKHLIVIRNFQRANASTLTKMKEACVRALIRGLQQPFNFADDTEFDNKQRAYKSLFD
jgi:hypothetical protein